MKQIKKNQVPQQFADWMTIDKMSHRPNWNRVPAQVRRVIHDALIDEQGFVCCYCESRIRRGNSHVEHFRPKKRFPDGQLDYSNLHCSCLREQSPGEPDHCGHRKGDWFDENLLVSPLQDGCEKRFMFTANGEIFPRSGDDEAARATIERLGLDLPKLNALRAAAVDAIRDLSTTEIEAVLVRGLDGSFPEYFTTIEDVLLRDQSAGDA